MEFLKNSSINQFQLVVIGICDLYSQIWLYLHMYDHHFFNLFLWMLAT
jgi:hypothetical protein